MPNQYLCSPLTDDQLDLLRSVSLQETTTAAAADLQILVVRGFIRRTATAARFEATALGNYRAVLGRKPSPESVDAAAELFKLAQPVVAGTDDRVSSAAE